MRCVLALAFLAYSACAADYSHELAKRLVNYCGATYCVATRDIAHWSCLPCRQVPGFQQITPIHNTWNHTDATAIVGYDPTIKARIVAFMGTNAALDTWIDDVLFLPSSCYSELGCSGCNCHPGFKKTYQSIADDVYKAVSKLPAGKLIITGHSLGAAQATHCAIDLNNRGIKPDHIYTVGQPRVGNVEFADWYNHLGLDHWRITHHRDPIPHLPWRGLGGYRQVLQEAYYKDAHASAPTKICDAKNSEDPTCADQFNDEATLPFIADHWSYLGFAFAPDVLLCSVAEVVV
jgi:hypothetical protein